MARDKGKPKIINVDDVKPKISAITGEEDTTYVENWAIHANEPIGLLLTITYVADESGTVKRR